MTDQFGQVMPPTPVKGNVTRVWEGQVVSVEPGGMVSVQKANSRSARHRVKVPLGYTPTLGDRLLLTDLDGNRQYPAILQVLSAAVGSLTSGFGTYAARPAAADATGMTYVATDVVATYLSTGTAWLRTSTPAGTLMPFSGSAVPDGHLVAAGQSLLRTGIYADLFAALGTTYGSADGTHFNLPDLRGRVPVALDNLGGTDAGRLAAANTLGDSGGVEKVTLTSAQSGLPSHNHTQNPHTHQPVGYDARGAGGGSGGAILVRPDWGPNFGLADDGSGISGKTATNNANAAADAASSHDNMPPYLLTNYLVKL